MKISLKAARVNAGLTQDDVIKATGFARSTIIRWEKGRVIPKKTSLQTLCNLYNVSVEMIDLERSKRKENT